MTARPARPNSHNNRPDSLEPKEIPSGPTMNAIQQEILRLAAGADPEDQPGYRLRRLETRRMLILLLLAAFVPLPSYLCRTPEAVVPPAPVCIAPACVSGSGLDGLWWGSKLDLNTATVEELQVVSGVGPRLAARIIDHREANGPFDRFEDVEDVKGVGPKLATKLAGFVEVRAGKKSRGGHFDGAFHQEDTEGSAPSQ